MLLMAGGAVILELVKDAMCVAVVISSSWYESVFITSASEK